MEQLYLSALNRYTKPLLFLIISIALFFGYHIKNFQLDASSDSLILEQDKDLKKFREVSENYETNDFLIITFTDKKKIITDQNLDKIKFFIKKIDALKWVESTQSIFDVPLLEVNNQSLTDLIDGILTIESPDINLDDVEKELLESPIFKNLIISEDASSTGVLINFKKNYEYENLIKERSRLNEISGTVDDNSIREKINREYENSKKAFDNERHNNIQEIRKTIDDFKVWQSQQEGDILEIHLGGVSMIADDTITFVKNDIFIFGLGAIFFILLVLFLVFKNPIWMFACISNCFISLIVMVGIVSLSGWKVTVISSNFIMLMLILSLSMTVHIVVRYRQVSQEYSELKNTDLVFITVKQMYKPCLFAALTTIFAFATLYSSGIKPVMDFGLMMCAGLLITYLSSFTFLPILINTLNLNSTFYNVKNNNANIYVFISKSIPNLLILLFFFLFILGLYGTTKLEVENSFIDYFKKDTEIYKGMKLIDDKLGGTTPLDIIIDFDQSDPTSFQDEAEDEDEFLDFGIEYDPLDYWFTKEKIDIIKNLHDHLESYPFSGKVLSLASIVRTAEKLNSNNEFDSLELSVLYKKLPQDLKDQIIKPYVLIDKNQARITMRLIDTHPELKRSEFVNELNNHINNYYSSTSTKISLTGILILYNNMLQSLFDSQIKSLSIVLTGIFLMLLILFRSFKIALIAIIPNALACFLILGTMGLISIPLDLMTITIAAITIGIAVDNCIHYVYRYREYLEKTNNHNEAMESCNRSVGIAIRNTSYTIIAGFSILIFSNFYPTIYFGIFTALAMFIALVGSLTLLPVLLNKFY